MKFIAFVLLLLASFLSILVSSTKQIDVLFYGGFVGLAVSAIELGKMFFLFLFHLGPHFCPVCGHDWQNSQVTTRNKEKWKCPGCYAENKF